MVKSAALVVDQVLPEVSMRQWVLSVPFALRLPFAREQRVDRRRDRSHLPHDRGAVTLVERFGSALHLNVHFHMLMPDGVNRRRVPHRSVGG